MGGILSQISLLNSEADQRGIVEECKRQVKDIWEQRLSLKACSYRNISI